MKGFQEFLIYLASFLCLVNGQFEARTNLTFRIKGVYKGTGIDSLGIRGNGLGLKLFESTPMTKDEGDVWTLDIIYQSDLHGFYSMDDSVGFIPNGDDFKISFWGRSADSEVNMVGDVFRIPLPVSEVSEYFETKPEFQFYPYFFSTEGNIVVLEIDSEVDSIGTRKIVVYMPPGFSENTRPVYDVFYMIDFFPGFIDFFKPALDQIFIDGVARDAVVVGHGDFVVDPDIQDASLDRALQLTPVSGDNFVCKEGTFADNCNFCLPENFTFTPENLIHWFVVEGCGSLLPSGGNADVTIQFLLTKVYDQVNEYLRLDYESSLTSSRDGTFVLGYSLGGLFSCYAAWTCPNDFGGAACQSSSFWWPLSVSGEIGRAGFYFVNETLKTHLDDRLPQKIVIDVGELEEDSLFQMASITTSVYKFMSSHPMLKANREVWHQIYPGKSHTFEAWLQRIWNAFKILSMGKN